MFITAMIEGSGWLFFLSIVLSTCCSRVASMFEYLRDYICFKATIAHVLTIISHLFYCILVYYVHISYIALLMTIALHSSSECPFIWIKYQPGTNKAHTDTNHESWNRHSNINVIGHSSRRIIHLLNPCFSTVIFFTTLLIQLSGGKTGLCVSSVH